MERVVAVEVGDGWAASFEDLRGIGVVIATEGSLPFVVLWETGAASALDTDEIARGRDVGQTAVFDRRLSGRTLTFERSREGYFDRETGSRWDFAGRAVSGPLQGSRLDRIPHGDHFWFAWIVFRPNTTLWNP
jgi:hypothetical protein